MLLSQCYNHSITAVGALKVRYSIHISVQGKSERPYRNVVQTAPESGGTAEPVNADSKPRKSSGIRHLAEIEEKLRMRFSIFRREIRPGISPGGPDIR